MPREFQKIDSTGPRPRNAPSVTVERILNAAQQVLITSGYASFTMRHVAQSAGISPGNLTYHFPTKNALLRALISRLIEGYSRQMDEILSSPEVPIEQELEMLVNVALMDNVAEGTVRISRELWAMALHDEVIRDAVDDFYDELMERMVNMLQRSRPKAEKAAIQEIVHVLLLLAEGTSVIFGTRRERAVSVERIIEVATPLLESLEPKRQAPVKVSG